MGPINYAMQVQSPFEGQLAGIKIGATLADMEAALAKQALERQQAQQTMARQQAFGDAVSAYFAKPDRTFADLAPALALAGNKDQLEALKAVGEGMGKEQALARQKVAGQLLVALEANPSVAVDMLKQRVEATADPAERTHFANLLQVAQTDPTMAARAVELGGAAEFGKDWIDNIAKVRQTRREETLFVPQLAKAVADAEKAGVDAKFAPGLAQANLTEAQSKAFSAQVSAKYAEQVAQTGLQLTQTQIAQARNAITVASENLKLNREKLAIDAANVASQISERAGKIPEGALKLVNEAAISSAAAKQSADQLNSLADRITSIGTSWGALGSASEWLAKSTGSQDAVTALRQEYLRLRNDAAIRSLPPGPATDRDIALAMKGFPPETANPQIMSQFLRGMAKLQDITAKVEASKGEFLAQNKGMLTRASGPFIAGDYSVKPGESFTDLAARIAKSVNDQYVSGSAGLVGQIPGYAPAGVPAPGPAAQPSAASIRSQADAIIRGGR